MTPPQLDHTSDTPASDRFANSELPLAETRIGATLQTGTFVRKVRLLLAAMVVVSASVLASLVFLADGPVAYTMMGLLVLWNIIGFFLILHVARTIRQRWAKDQETHIGSIDEDDD